MLTVFAMVIKLASWLVNSHEFMFPVSLIELTWQKIRFSSKLGRLKSKLGELDQTRESATEWTSS